jgi:hypothetical protein
MMKQPLPKHWYRLQIDGLFVYLNDVHKTAQYEHPGLNLARAMPRTSPNPIVHKPKHGPLVYVYADVPFLSCEMTISGLSRSRDSTCLLAGRR